MVWYCAFCGRHHTVRTPRYDFCGWKKRGNAAGEDNLCNKGVYFVSLLKDSCLAKVYDPVSGYPAMKGVRKMELPKKVNILGLTYDVQEVEVVDRGEALWGKIDHNSQVIRIDANATEERKGQTFLHEVLHGVLAGLGFEELNADESAVQSISAALYHALSSI